MTRTVLCVVSVFWLRTVGCLLDHLVWQPWMYSYILFSDKTGIYFQSGREEFVHMPLLVSLGEFYPVCGPFYYRQILSIAYIRTSESS